MVGMVRGGFIPQSAPPPGGEIDFYYFHSFFREAKKSFGFKIYVNLCINELLVIYKGQKFKWIAKQAKLASRRFLFDKIFVLIYFNTKIILIFLYTVGNKPRRAPRGHGRFFYFILIY